MPKTGGFLFGFGLLGAPIAWLLHLSVSYFLVTLACTGDSGTPRWGILVATFGFAIVAASAGMVAYRGWRRLPSPAGSDGEPGASRGRFLLVTGMLLAGLFVVLIVLAGLPPLFVPACG